MRGRKLSFRIVLSDDEQATLEHWLRSTSIPSESMGQNYQRDNEHRGVTDTGIIRMRRLPHRRSESVCSRQARARDG